MIDHYAFILFVPPSFEERIRQGSLRDLQKILFRKLPDVPLRFQDKARAALLGHWAWGQPLLAVSQDLCASKVDQMDFVLMKSCV